MVKATVHYTTLPPFTFMLKRLLSLSLLTVLCLLCGCKEVIYHNLSERHANDMVLTLLKGGVEADKQSEGEKGYSVAVDGSKMALAIELLNANAQPEEAYPSMGELFGHNQMISTPTEERIRFIFGIEQGLSATLSKIDGVLISRVHIVLPSNDPLATDLKPASASVFLKHRPDVNMQVVVPAVKDLVVRSVEGLTPERVAVTLFPANTTATNPNQVPITRFFGALVASSSTTTLWTLLATPWLVVLILLGMLFKATELRKIIKARFSQKHGRSTRKHRDEDDVSEGVL